MLQWAHLHWCPWDVETCNDAAINGHCSVVPRTHAHGCPLSPTASKAAAKNAKWAIVQWLLDNECRGDESDILKFNNKKNLTFLAPTKKQKL